MENIAGERISERGYAFRVCKCAAYRVSMKVMPGHGLEKINHYDFSSGFLIPGFRIFICFCELFMQKAAAPTMHVGPAPVFTKIFSNESFIQGVVHQGNRHGHHPEQDHEGQVNDGGMMNELIHKKQI